METKEMFKEFEFNEKPEKMIFAVNGLTLPDDYLAFMREHNGGEGALGENNYGRFYRLEELEEINNEYGVQENWPGYIVIGGADDTLWAYNPEKKIYCQIDSCNAGEDTYYTISDSLEQFLINMDEELKEDDPIDFESMYTVVEKLGIRGYKMMHLKTSKKIWKEQVPESGQSDSLQGELLRQVEKLRNEALGNGNINWDDNYAWFCDFLTKTLSDSGIFPEAEKEKISGAIGYIKECGEYARRYRKGEIADKDVNPMLLAYVDHDLYDYVADAVALFAEKNPDPVPYEKKSFIYR